MRIITLTLCPAFDVHCYVKDFAPYRESLATVTRREAGGKGINVSRALAAAGVESLALVLLGDGNGADFASSLDADGLTYRSITVGGRIRENLTIHTDGADETRISFEGFRADASVLRKLSALLDAEELDGSFVTLTGRLPTGMDMPSVKAFLRGLADRGARIVIDSKSFSLDDIIEVKPYLIKPNAEEISEYLGREVGDFSEVRAAAEELYAKGIENVMISLGDKGALLVCESGAYVATPPRIDAISTIGAGDGTIGGFLAALSEGRKGAEALRLAVAYGTAACLTEGTLPPRIGDIEEIFAEVETEKFNL